MASSRMPPNGDQLELWTPGSCDFGPGGLPWDGRSPREMTRGFALRSSSSLRVVEKNSIVAELPVGGLRANEFGLRKIRWSEQLLLFISTPDGG